jgi:hypothetical protein
VQANLGDAHAPAGKHIPFPKWKIENGKLWAAFGGLMASGAAGEER